MRVDLEREWGRLHERMQPTPFTLARSPLPFPSPSSSHPPPFLSSPSLPLLPSPPTLTKLYLVNHKAGLKTDGRRREGGKDNIPLTSLTLSAISSPFPPSSVSLVFLLSSPNANLVTLSLIPFLLLHLTYFLIHLIIFILAKPFLYPSIIDILTNLINFIIPIPFPHPSLILYVTLVILFIFL